MACFDGLHHCTGRTLYIFGDCCPQNQLSVLVLNVYECGWIWVPPLSTEWNSIWRSYHASANIYVDSTYVIDKRIVAYVHTVYVHTVLCTYCICTYCIMYILYVCNTKCTYILDMVYPTRLVSLSSSLALRAGRRKGWTHISPVPHSHMVMWDAKSWSVGVCASNVYTPHYHTAAASYIQCSMACTTSSNDGASSHGKWHQQHLVINKPAVPDIQCAVSTISHHHL